MGRAMEMVTALTTAPGAAFTAATVLTGQSLTVRDSRRPTRLISQFDRRQGDGVTRITSALLHDSTIGMQRSCPTANGSNIIHSVPQMLQAQDLLGVQMTGSAAAGDIEHTSLIILYDDLPGVMARLSTPAEVARRAVNLLDNTITVATGVTGQYTGAVAVNSAQDAFKANTDYALIGYSVSGDPVHAIAFQGPDWGNLIVGGPGIEDENAIVTATWFVQLGQIPVMNSANKALTQISAVADENGLNPIVTMHWAELR